MYHYICFASWIEIENFKGPGHTQYRWPLKLVTTFQGLCGTLEWAACWILLLLSISICGLFSWIRKCCSVPDPIVHSCMDSSDFIRAPLNLSCQLFWLKYELSITKMNGRMSHITCVVWGCTTVSGYFCTCLSNGNDWVEAGFGVHQSKIINTIGALGTG